MGLMTTIRSLSRRLIWKCQLPVGLPTRVLSRNVSIPSATLGLAHIYTPFRSRCYPRLPCGYSDFKELWGNACLCDPVSHLLGGLSVSSSSIWPFRDACHSWVFQNPPTDTPSISFISNIVCWIVLISYSMFRAVNDRSPFEASAAPLRWLIGRECLQGRVSCHHSARLNDHHQRCKPNYTNLL